MFYVDGGVAVQVNCCAGAMPCSNVSGDGGVHWIAGQEQECTVGINAVDFSVDLKVCAGGLLRQLVGSPEGEALWRECGFPGGGFFSVEQ